MMYLHAICMNNNRLYNGNMLLTHHNGLNWLWIAKIQQPHSDMNVSTHFVNPMNK